MRSPAEVEWANLKSLGLSRHSTHACSRIVVMCRSVCNALAGTSLIGLLAATLAACIPTQRTAHAAPSGAAPSSADSTAAACARLPDLPSLPADALDVTGFGADLIDHRQAMQKATQRGV